MSKIGSKIVHGIRLEINANLRDNDFLTKEVNEKERITFQHEIN